MQKLLMPADGVDPATLDGPGDETALDVGGEFFGDGDGSGKAFWPGMICHVNCFDKIWYS